MYNGHVGTLLYHEKEAVMTNFFSEIMVSFCERKALTKKAPKLRLAGIHPLYPLTRVWKSGKALFRQSNMA